MKRKQTTPKNPFFDFVLILILSIFAYVLLLQLFDASKFNAFQIRDLRRAEDLYFGTEIAWYGSELSGGGRMWGIFFYALIGLPLLFGGNWLSSWYLMIAMSALSCSAAAIFFKREFGPWPALFAFFFPLMSLAHLMTLTHFYNPSFLDLFLVGMLICLYYAYKKFSLKWWFAFCFLTFLATQLHVTILTFLPFILILQKYAKRFSVRPLPWWPVSLGLVFAFSPIWLGSLLFKSSRSEEGFHLWSGLSWYFSVKAAEWSQSFGFPWTDIFWRIQKVLGLGIIGFFVLFAWFFLREDFMKKLNGKKPFVFYSAGLLSLLSLPLGYTFVLSGYDIRYLQIFNFAWMFTLAGLLAVLMKGVPAKRLTLLGTFVVLSVFSYLSIESVRSTELKHPLLNATMVDMESLTKQIEGDWGISWKELQMRFFYIDLIPSQSPEYFFKKKDGPIKERRLATVFVLDLYKLAYKGPGWTGFLSPSLQKCFENGAYSMQPPIILGYLAVIYALNEKSVESCPKNFGNYGFPYEEKYFESFFRDVPSDEVVRFESQICEDHDLHCKFGMDIKNIQSNEKELEVVLWGTPFSLTSAWYGPDRVAGAQDLILNFKCSNQTLHSHLLVEAVGSGIHEPTVSAANTPLTPLLFKIPNYCDGKVAEITFVIKKIVRSESVFYSKSIKISKGPEAFKKTWSPGNQFSE